MNDLIISAIIALAGITGTAAPVNGPASALWQRAMAFSPASPDSSDAALNTVRQSDRASRRPDGKLAELAPADHMRRGSIYLSNRIFENAREHFQTLIDRYPKDSNVAAAYYGIGRSYFLAGRYAEAAPVFERIYTEFPATREGRDGLSMYAAALLRAGKASDAALRYIEYTEKYPAGERVESSYLNVIDAYREAGRSAEALKWVDITRNKFRGTVTELNAVFARLRFDVSAADWQHAVQTADEIRALRFQSGAQTSPDELSYLKAYSLERSGRVSEAATVYLSIPDSSRSFYGMLATERLQKIGTAALRPAVNARISRARDQIRTARSDYPVPYREAILTAASRRGVDPRIVLSIMRQESSFRPGIKSPAAARGLLQLTMDTAMKYAPGAGINGLTETDLYRPETSIRVGTEALYDLDRKFPNLPEAVAASYNGGDDNVARWVKRAQQKDRGVFAAEVGFNETKDYIFKVLANYRAYSELYTIDLRSK
jgi:soluble lytic murein transglycosylase-like protein